MATGDQQMKDIEKGGDLSSADDNNGQQQQNETSFNNENNDNVQLQPLLDGDVAAKSDNAKKNDNDEFYGLSKEELEKYAKDPKWVKIRWILFGLFMAGWLAMLIAAIVIVVVTPKCPPAPAMKWYQSGVMYKVKTARFQDSNEDGDGDLKGMENRCDHFEDLGVESVYIEDLMVPGQGLDKPDSKLGSLDDFKTLAAALKKKGIRVVIDLDLKGMSTNSKWFSDFSDDFLKKSKCPQTADQSTDILEPCSEPSNWKSVGGQQFYIPESDGDIARFDLSSENLRTRLEGVLKEWAAAGAEGFVVTSPEGQEARLSPILKRFQEILDDDFNNLDDRDRVIIAKDTESSDVKATITNPQPNCTALSQADCNMKSLKVIAENIQGAEDLPWRIPKIDSDILKRSASKSQLALKLMVPGTPIVQYGDEIGAMADNLYMKWDDSSSGGFTGKKDFELPVESRRVESVQAQMSAGYPGKSQYNLFKKLVTLRQDHPSLLWGQMNVVEFGGDTLVFTREAQGHPVIVVALNVGSTARSGSIARDELTGGEVLLTDGVNVEVEDMFDASAVYLPPDGVLVVRLQEPEEE